MDGVGETDFEIHPEEITDSIKAGLEEPIYPEPEVRWLLMVSLACCELSTWCRAVCLGSCLVLVS